MIIHEQMTFGGRWVRSPSGKLQKIRGANRGLEPWFKNESSKKDLVYLTANSLGISCGALSGVR